MSVKIEFDGTNKFTFTGSGSYSGSETVNSQTIQFSSITVSDGIQIEIDSGITSSITIQNSTFEKSCWIGSSVSNCKFKQNGNLIIGSSQSQDFKFNKINIHGESESITFNGTNENLILNCEESFSISSTAIGIKLENSLGLVINNYGPFSIVSTNGDAITCQNSATGIINNYGNFTINSYTGITIGKSSIINNFGELNFKAFGDGIYSDPTGTLIFNNFNQFIADCGNDIISTYSNTTVSINNYGLINLKNTLSHGIYCYTGSSLSFENFGTILINTSQFCFHFGDKSSTQFTNTGVFDIVGHYGFYCNGNSSCIFNNSTNCDFNLSNSDSNYGFDLYGNLTITITNQLFEVITDNIRTGLCFSKTPSHWNGRTLTNSMKTNVEGVSSILSYSENGNILESTIQNHFPKIEGNRLLNDNEYPLVLIRGVIPETDPIIQVDGVLVLQPHSSLEIIGNFSIPEDSTLIVSKEAKINNCKIQSESVILLKSELKDFSINSAIVII